MMMGIFLEKRKENNIYKSSEVHFLKEMPDAERVCWLKFVWIGGGNLNGLQQEMMMQMQMEMRIMVIMVTMVVIKFG